MEVNKFIYFTMSGFTILLILVINYVRNKKEIIVENKIYNLLILFSMIGMGFEFLMTYAAPFLEYSEFTKGFVSKTYLIVVEIWTMLIIAYTIFVVKGTDNRIDKSRKVLLIITLSSFIICAILTYVLPIEYGYNATHDSWMYTYGPSTMLVSVYAGVAMAITIYLTIINKNLKEKRMVPVYIFMVAALFTNLVQRIYPEAILISFAEAIDLMFMYIVLENPDTKLLEELQLAKNLSEKSNRIKSDFLSSMSHEIRTPLNTIVGLSVDNLEFAGQLPPDVEENCKDIVGASKILLDIVGNILSINDLDASNIDIEENPYNLREEVVKLSKTIVNTQNSNSIKFNLNISKNLPEILVGDKAHILEIITNLLTNAFKYTDSGNVDLTITYSGDSKDKCEISISCKDTGRGISKEAMEKIFNKFERQEQDINTTTSGTGLGLAITKSLVELMGGKIRVESEIGVGSNFIIDLPQKLPDKSVDIISTTSGLDSFMQAAETNNMEVVELNSSADDLKIDVVKADYNGRKVLVVDDNYSNIKVSKRTLRGFNVEIDTVMDGQSCIDKINSGIKYDVILMDIMMPKLSGTKTLQKLKENPNFNTPVIAVTADALSGAKEKYLNQGFSYYLSKPVNKIYMKKALDTVFKL